MNDSGTVLKPGKKTLLLWNDTCREKQITVWMGSYRTMFRKEIYFVQPILDLVGSRPLGERFDLNGDMIRLARPKMFAFKRMGTKCVRCGIEGKFFAKERFPDQHVYHLNLYGVKESGENVMLTVDHIIPKVAGGENTIENYQTMCWECNQVKDSYVRKGVGKF